MKKNASPLAATKDKFGDKAKLVAAVETFAKSDDLWLGRTNENKGLAHVSNAKLLKLHATFTAVKAEFGTRAKLITAVCELEKRKDAGYKTRLEAFPVPRLYDMYKSAKKRTDVAAKAKAAPKAAKAAKPAAAKKPAAKKTAAKKA
jgi:hypothetical protein